jgi:hypothetical protein
MCKKVLSANALEIFSRVEQCKEQKDAWETLRKQAQEEFFAEVGATIEEVVADEVDTDPLALTKTIQWVDSANRKLGKTTVGYKMSGNPTLLAELVAKHPAAAQTLVRVKYEPNAREVLKELTEPSGEFKRLLSQAIGYKVATPTLTVE